MNSSLLFLLCLFCFSFVGSHARAPAIFLFGDSLLDAGNNNYLNTTSKAIVLPYGIDHPFGNTGRFTNGRTIGDFYAEWLGLQYQRPYLQVTSLHLTEFYNGLNYASGSAGVFNETSDRNGMSLSLGRQVDLFSTTVKRLIPLRHRTKQRRALYLAKSIFVVNIGSNDIFYNFLQNYKSASTLPSNPEQFSDLLVSTYQGYLKDLHQLGARKFVVSDIAALGCIPAVAGELRKKNQCNETINDIVKMVNTKYELMIDDLRNLEGSIFVFAKSYNLTYDIAQNPKRHGIAASTPCIINNTTACGNRTEHAFFDGVHPSEITYKTIASEFFNGTSLCFPINVKQLSEI